MGTIQTFKEKKEELSSSLLAVGYLFCKGVVALTMEFVYRLFGLRKERVTLRHAEIYLISTTVLLVALIALAQLWPPLGWLILILGNLRILQIICINLLTLLFDFTPTSGSDAALKRARWHFLAMGFSLFDAILVFGYMFQFLDDRWKVLNQHFTNYLDYFYYSFVTISTLGYGEIHPLTTLGRCLVCYEIAIFLFMIVFFVSGISGRFERHT